MSFLMGLGVEDMIGKSDPESPEFRAAIHLLKPDGMGSTFKMLVQHKGIESAGTGRLEIQTLLRLGADSCSAA